MTPENAMKWGSLAPTVGNYDFADADAIADFAASAGVRLRGHTLLWKHQLPADLEDTVEAATDPAAKLRELIDEHLSTVVPRYRDGVAVWDVVNESLHEFTGDLDLNIFGRTLGETYIDEAFRRVHELDPDAQLVLNEFFVFYGLGTPFEGKARGFIDLVERLLDRGVPVHGVGVQAHFSGLAPDLIPLPTREEFEGFLRALADLGVFVELTELDVSINYFRGDPDPFARQAEFYGEVVEACMAVPRCTAVTTWGIDDSRTWLDRSPPFDTLAPHEPLLFDAVLEPKPAYFAMRDAVAARIARSVDKATVKIQLKFNKPSKDKIQVKIKEWQLPAGVVPTDVTVDVGGAAFTGTLDANGRYKSADGRDSIKMKEKNGLWKLTVKRKKNDFATSLADEGCTDADNPKPGLPVTVPLIINVGGVAYGQDVDLVYTSKVGKKGTAK
jgi:endo-1,4-beta-xylanase